MRDIDEIVTRIQQRRTPYEGPRRCVEFIRDVYREAGIELPPSEDAESWSDLFEPVGGMGGSGDIVYMPRQNGQPHLAVLVDGERVADINRLGEVVRRRLRSMFRLEQVEVYRYVGPGADAQAR